MVMFDDKMTFDNYGKYWTIDHVYPCSKFDLTNNENQYKCFNWTNLRPLSKIENNKKVNKIDDKVLKDHITNTKTFLKYLPENEKNNYKIIE